MDLSSSSLHFDTHRDELIIYERDTSFGIADDNYVNVGVEYGGDYINGGEYQERTSILVDGGEHYGVTAVAFDTHEELLWMGNQGGHVTSYYGPDLQKYTSFQVHGTDEVRSLHTVEGGVLALMPSTLRYQLRRGIPILTHSSENMQEMQCLLQLHNSPDTILLGGHSQKLIEFNLSQGREIQSIQVGDAGCAILRQHSRFICCGDPTGQITLRDPKTRKAEHTLDTHTGSLSDFDVHGHLLVSCGFSNRQGALSVDSLLLVYDLRMLRSVAPIPVLVDPFLLRFMPSFSSRLTVASPMGHLQFVETVTLSEPNHTIYQVRNATSLITALDVSSTSQAVCWGDAGGNLHMLTSGASPVFNAYSRPTEFADPIQPYEPIDMDDTMAIYSGIPLPVINGPLLSDWPGQYLKRQYRRTPAIDPEILRTMKMQGTIGYAPNPNTRRRNQPVFVRLSHYPSMIENPRNHRWPKVPAEYLETGKNRSESRTKEEGSGGFVAIPKRYRKPDMKHLPKTIEEAIVVDDNYKAKFCGLEATLPNSYCNAMLQVLFFTEPLRSVIQGHICRGEFCVCCELGFLFHMMSTSGGVPCHSGNLLRALRSAKEASALHLILSDNPTSLNEANYILLIQSWNRFILHQLHSELLECKRKGKEAKPAFVYRDTDFPSIDLQQQRKIRTKPKADLNEDVLDDSTKGETDITKLFGSKQEHVFTCLKCNNKGSKEATLIVLNLTYPNFKGEQKDVSFCDVLSNSIGGSQVTPAWCDPCHKFQPTRQERKVKSLPQLLSVNCGNNNESDKRFWKDQIEMAVMKIFSTTGVELRSGGNGKQCRYGNTCTRVGCRFKHSNQNSSGPENKTASVPLHLYYSNPWVPAHVRMNVTTDGEVSVEKVEESKLDNEVELPENVVQSMLYDLYGVVCYVNDERKNIVAIVNVGPLYHIGASEISQWYIFNDFSITPVGGQEAVWFSIDWKVPCVLYWQEHTSRLVQNTSAPLQPATQAFTPDLFVDAAKCATITPLGPHEVPQPGELVAMDAEFVTLNQEESELRSDGKLATIKPSQMSVARISCVRGQGPLEGTAFIDDYISTQEQVFDYLTKFSGIKPGDLDVTCSSKHLTTLKSTYMKLRSLIDSGVKFVGHGLKNDFRVINLVVPSDQVIDTVHLFHLPHQRMVSLRFLAWHFLGVKIQSETHDSIEDARAALHLYKKYLELEQSGVLKENLEEMYNTGKSLLWKVPGDDIS